MFLLSFSSLCLCTLFLLRRKSLLSLNVSSIHILETIFTRSGTEIPIDVKLRVKAGILTTRSLCRMTRWIYTNDTGIKIVDKECVPGVWLGMKETGEQPSKQLMDASHLEEYDTIYVPHTALSEFVRNILVNLSVNIVVISGQTRNVDPGPESAIGALLDHPSVMRWFCQNLPKYGGSKSSQNHPKTSPFPYGLVDREWYNSGGYASFKRVFFESLNTSLTTNKTDLIFVGPLGSTNPWRASIPKMNHSLRPLVYLAKMAQSRYVISPDGDRPDCYRHYEAIGLGTMPLTQLDPALYHHFGRNVIYNITDWNLTKLEERLDPIPVVNRNLVREAYWMEWANSIVGASLNWGDYENGNGLTMDETSLLSQMDWKSNFV